MFAHREKRTEKDREGSTNEIIQEKFPTWLSQVLRLKGPIMSKANEWKKTHTKNKSFESLQEGEKQGGVR
jgi:hypothetical protein